MAKERCEIWAHYMLENKTTIRKTAAHFGVSKSLVHNEFSKKLKRANLFLYIKTKKLLDKNFKEKHIRGGEATRKKYVV